MQRVLLALSLAAAATAYPITADDVNCRDSPGTDGKVVKTYAKDTDVDVTCQIDGESVSGNSIWDKTKDDCYVSDFYVKTGSDDYVGDKCDGDGGGGGGGGGDLPNLDDKQTKNAEGVFKQIKADDVGLQGCLAAFSTALVESEIYIWANKKVEESFDYPYDKVGEDYDSVGIFQQRVQFYPDVEADMDPAKSAGQFFDKMVAISGWEDMDVGELCQEIQGSALPEKYPERLEEAKGICKAGGYE